MTKSTYPSGDPDFRHPFSTVARILGIPRSTLYKRAYDDQIEADNSDGPWAMLERDIDSELRLVGGSVTGRALRPPPQIAPTSRPASASTLRLCPAPLAPVAPAVSETPPSAFAASHADALLRWARHHIKLARLILPPKGYAYRTADVGREQTAILTCLRSGLVPLVRYGRKIARCRPGKACRSIYCIRCRERRLLRSFNRFTGTPYNRSDLYFVTLIGGAASTIVELQRIIRTVKAAVDDQLRAARENSPRWRPVRWNGIWELEAIDPSLGPRKQAALEKLGLVPGTTRAINLHAHLLLDSGGLSKSTLELFFRRALATLRASDGAPSAIQGQVQVKRLKSSGTAEDQVMRVLGYILKGEIPLSKDLRSQVKRSRSDITRLPESLLIELDLEFAPILEIIQEIGGWSALRWNRRSR